MLINAAPINAGPVDGGGTVVPPPDTSNLQLVNTAPNKSTDPIVPGLTSRIKPGEPVQMSLRSLNSSIEPGSLRVLFGLTHLEHEGFLPENDPNLAILKANIQLQTSEHRLPITGTVPRSLSAGSLLFTKGSSSDNELGIYEIKFPIQNKASILGYFKFRTKTSWQLFNPDWCNLSSMTGMYFGLEHGSFNTAGYAFLRSPSFGHGSLVVGGPLQVYGNARPGQTEYTGFDWRAQPDNTVVEVWIYFNAIGYPPPFSPAYLPVLEVWTKIAGVDEVPVVRAQIPVGGLGTFQVPTSNFSNYRFGPSDYATLYFGNVGRNADVLQIDDWALFPDFEMVVSEGEARPTGSILRLPDTPTQFLASDALDPRALSPGRWFNIADAGFFNPSPSFLFQPGKKAIPQSLRLAKIAGAAGGFERIEPRLETLADGCTIEAFMSGDQTSRVADSFGAGICIEDGTKTYRAVMLQTETVTTIGISSSVTPDFEDYYVPLGSDGFPLPIDWSSLKLVRLIVDRLRSKVALVVDEVRVLEIPISHAFPPSFSASGRMSFGHLMSLGSAGTMDVSRLTYTNRYKAWEIIDQVIPGTTPAYVLQASGTGSTALDAAAPHATAASIAKTAFGSDGSYRYYQLYDDFSEVKGAQVDFEARVVSYTDGTSSPFSSLSWTGAGVTLFLGNKKLHLGFFDAGTSGRVLGVIPGSGTVEDIVNQTVLGRKFSTPVDWTQDLLYRLVIRGYNSIEVWVDSVAQDPVIVIPWRNDEEGFDLPVDFTSPSIAFGHFDGVSSSVTAWKAVRHSISNGYDMAVAEVFKDGAPLSAFGGRSFVSVSFDEEPPDSVPPVFSGLVSVVPTSGDPFQSLHLSWAPASDNISHPSQIVYDIYMFPFHAVGSFGTPTATSIAGATSYDLGGLAPGSQHTFVVRARDIAGNRDSNTVAVDGTTQMDVTPPVFTSGATLLDTPTTTSLTVHWSLATDTVSPQDEIGYLIYVATTPGGQNFSLADFDTGPGLITSAVISSLSPNTTYYIVVRAYDGQGNIDTNSIEVTATTASAGDTTPPIFGGAISATSIGPASVQWDWLLATDDVTAQDDIIYGLWWSYVSGGQDFGQPPVVTFIGGATEASTTSASWGHGNTIYFVIRAQDEAGNWDTNTVEVSCDVEADTTPPTFDGITSLEVNEDDAHFFNAGWSAGSDDVTIDFELQYNFYLSLTSGGQNFPFPDFSYSPGFSVPSPYLLTNGTELDPNTTYFVVIRAQDLSGNEDSNTVELSITTGP